MHTFYLVMTNICVGLLGITDVYHSDLQHDFTLALAQSSLSQVFTCPPCSRTKDGEAIFGWEGGLPLIPSTRLWGSIEGSQWGGGV